MHKQIKDPIHGYIELPEELISLTDSEKMQRLRNIKQLSFAYLVYPGANHTRFEHSLGVMHLASNLCENIDIDKDDKLLVKTAALLHDIGHGPYSHTSEKLCREFKEFSHDSIYELLKNDEEISAVLEENGTDAKEISQIITGHHRLAAIISGDLDVDRMDYLLRDAHYTGVPFGKLDTGRLIRSLIMTDSGLAIKETGISAAESLLIARTLMGPSVYSHHVGRIAEAMFILAGKMHLNKNTIDEFMKYDDMTAFITLLNSENEKVRTLIKRIQSRRLYKRAVYAGKNTADINRFTSMTNTEKQRLLSEICETAQVEDETQIILDIPPLRREMNMNVKVKNSHDLIPINEIFPMISIMNSVRKDQWRLGVYAPKEIRDKVSEAALSVLDLKKPTKQNRLTQDCI